jgi:phosphoenolpyruvate carboxykinase (ATP)
MNSTNSHVFESLETIGLRNTGRIFHNLSTPALYEEAIRRYGGMLSRLGPLVVRTGQFTGRLPNDKFIVREPSSEKNVWWGKVNRPFDPEKFEIVRTRLCAYLQGKDLFVQDCATLSKAISKVRARLGSWTGSMNLLIDSRYFR